MKCGHCLTEFHSNMERYDLGKDADSDWLIEKYICPSCNRFNIYFVETNSNRNNLGNIFKIDQIKKEFMIHPRAFSRMPIPHEVPKEFRNDYEEACLILTDSPKASAALSRRCLQHLLRDKGGFTSRNLADEIQQAIDSRTLPGYIIESIDAIRNIGNFAAHPLKATHSGEVMPVEAGEAEWNLDVIEMLFDFYFVQPATIQKKRDLLNQKLADAGKPPMK
jgi:hypothetical protein